MKKGRKIVKRDTTIDLLKGIGITSIVIGHVRSYLPGGFPIVAYVYTYHIMVFLFVAGMCFKPQNNISPFMQIGKRLGGLLPLYVIYSAFFVACHNLFRRAHILSNDIPKYGKREIVQNILNSLTFGNSERLLGAFWFVPMFFVAVSFFIIIFLHYDIVYKGSPPIALKAVADIRQSLKNSKKIPPIHMGGIADIFYIELYKEISPILDFAPVFS